jgi:hypothetical protein
MAMGSKYAKRYANIALVIAVILSFVPHKVGAFDISMLPSPFAKNYESGVLYELGNYRFAFNNGCLAFFEAHSNNVYVFKWNNGWKLEKILDHVDADSIGFIRSEVKIAKDDTIRIVASETNIGSSKDNVSSASSVADFNIALIQIVSKVVDAVVLSVLMLIPRDVKMFVKNKVPDVQVVPLLSFLTVPVGFYSHRDFYLYTNSIIGGDL